MTQREPPLRSKKYRDGSRGQPCTFRIPGVCTGGGEDTVFAHIGDRHTGRSVKASDTSGADVCFNCHTVIDGRSKMPDGFLITSTEWLFYALRGMQETVERRVRQGIISIPLTIERPKASKPKTKPEKAKSQWPRRKMESRSTFPKPSTKQ